MLIIIKNIKIYINNILLFLLILYNLNFIMNQFLLNILILDFLKIILKILMILKLFMIYLNILIMFGYLKIKILLLNYKIKFINLFNLLLSNIILLNN